MGLYLPPMTKEQVFWQDYTTQLHLYNLQSGLNVGHDMKMTININVMQIGRSKMLVHCTVVDNLNVR